MNVPTIEMDPQEARDKQFEYESKGDSLEDAAIAAGFEALADGKRLLSLATVFANVRRDHQHRPLLAIARADRQVVRYDNRGLVDSFCSNYRQRVGRAANDAVITIPRTTHVNYAEGYSIVPLVPPAIRTRRNLSKYFILWDVGRWADTDTRVEPDKDPFLLKRVEMNVDLYSIEAEWDLTPLEQWALGQRVAQR